MQTAHELIDKIVDALPVDLLERYRILATVRGELYSALTFRYLQLGQIRESRRMALRAIRSKPALVRNRGLLSILSGYAQVPVFK